MNKLLKFLLDIQTFASPTIKKTTYIKTADDKTMDVSKEVDAEIAKKKRVNTTYKQFTRKTAVESDSMTTAKKNPMDYRDGYTIKTLEKVNQPASKGLLDIDDTYTIVVAKTGDQYIEREHTVDAIFQDKFFYSQHDVKGISVKGSKLLNRAVRDIASIKADWAIQRRKAFLTAYANAFGTVNKGMLGLAWTTKYNVSGTDDKFSPTAITDLATTIAAAKAGKRYVTGLDSTAAAFNTSEKRGEAIYEWAFEVSGYLEKLGSDVEPEHPTVEDGFEQTAQGIVLSRQGGKDLKKFLANASVNTSIVIEKGMITSIIFDQVSIPVMIENRSITKGGKEMIAAVQVMGENAPVSEFAIGKWFFETISAGERMTDSRDTIMNYTSPMTGTSITEPEFLFGLFA